MYGFTMHSHPSIPAQSSKLPEVGTTIFTVMSQLAAEHGAVNLGQGFPDFSPPARLVDELARALREGHHQYPPMAGTFPLREAIARKTARAYGHTPDPEHEITVTSGATEALFNAIHAVVRAGDEVIVLDPAYDSYAPAIALAGALSFAVLGSQSSGLPDWSLGYIYLPALLGIALLSVPFAKVGANLAHRLPQLLLKRLFALLLLSVGLKFLL